MTCENTLLSVLFTKKEEFMQDVKDDVSFC